MIVKLAEFESGIEKEAGLSGSIKNTLRKMIEKPNVDLDKVVDEITHKVQAGGNWSKGRATAIGSGSGKLVNNILGGNATGTIGEKTNELIDHIKRNAPTYGGAGILGAGAGAYALKNRKHK